MTLCDMEDDRARLEQGKIAFLVGRTLPERMQRPMRGFLHSTERDETNLVRLAHFFKRPANAHVARQAPAAIRRPLEDGNGRDNGDFSFGRKSRRVPDAQFYRSLTRRSRWAQIDIRTTLGEPGHVFYAESWTSRCFCPRIPALPVGESAMKTTGAGGAEHYRWMELPAERLKGGLNLDVDIFDPPRQDWLAGTDAYLRGTPGVSRA